MVEVQSKWEEYVRDLKYLGNPLASHGESLKENLMNKLPFDKYNWVHITPDIFVNKDESPMSIEALILYTSMLSRWNRTIAARTLIPKTLQTSVPTQNLAINQFQELLEDKKLMN